MITPVIQAAPETSTAPIPRLLLDPKQAAEALAVSERTLFEHTQSKEIPSFKLGRLVRYSVLELEKWVAGK